MLTFHIITIFPEAFESVLAHSIIGRAIKNKLVRVKFYNPRDFTKDKHRKTDDRPYGGGPGMVMYAAPIVAAVKKAIGLPAGKAGKKKAEVVLFATSGKQFTNEVAKSWALGKTKDIVLICGHYEGVDARVKKILRAKEISVGPYILTGGELPAMTVVDVVSRQIKGVLGKFESLEEKRAASSEIYTRPEVLVINGKKYRVPKVMLSGDHKKIEEYRRNALKGAVK